MLNELPLYRDTFDLVSLITDYTTEFPKKYKYTVGDKLLNTSLNLFDSLVKANINHTDSDQHDMYMSEYVNTYLLVRTLTRLVIEKKIISLKLASSLAMIFESIEEKLELNKS